MELYIDCVILCNMECETLCNRFLKYNMFDCLCMKLYECNALFVL